MKHRFREIVTIALGGSIVFPDKIDWQFLKKFRKFLLLRLRGRRFIIVVGGGRLARIYQEAAAKIARLTDEDQDWIGIYATRLNANLLRTIFRDVADPVVIDSRYKIKKLNYPVTIASGWRPGRSTDCIAVQLATDFGVREVVIAGKPAFVYNKDNSKYRDARPLSQLKWKEYKKLIPARWKSGLHVPVDPVAARLAEKNKIKAIVINGKNLKNFAALLNGKNFSGTIVG